LEIESAGQVYADPRRLRQVMDNLLTNAVKFSPPGSQVSVSAGRTGSTWSVRVRDQGPGIGELDRQRIFQAFSRLNTRPTGGEKGTGLGLAISRWIIEAHGGEIGVISNPGQGAEFWFTLPEKSLPDSQGARQI
jgi:signal transduction histidine kinase